MPALLVGVINYGANSFETPTIDSPVLGTTSESTPSSAKSSNPPPDIMTSLRAFRLQDLFHMSLTNLDPLTENYNIDYYMNYMMTWPSLFTVAEDQEGNIIGYSTPPSFLTVESRHHTANNSAISHGQSRRRS